MEKADLQRHSAQHGSKGCVAHRVQVIGVPFSSGRYCIVGDEKADGSVYDGCNDSILPEGFSGQGRAIVVHLREAHQCR